MKKTIILCLLLCLTICCACQKADETAVSTASGLEIFDGTGLTGQYVNPFTTGKVTILNFWGTWCPYCVYEMPHLDRIATEYREQVTVIAAHTDIAGTDAPAYVAQNYANSDIIFVNDADNACYSALHGQGSYPYSLILSADGTVVTSFYGYQDLAQWTAMIEELIK